MSNAASLAPLMVVEEFQDWQPDPGEEDWRWQLIEGAPFGMAPASNPHRAIQDRTCSILDNHLAALGRCVVLSAPGVIPVERSAINQLVPDLGVSCAEQPPGNTVHEPILLVEVLSKSNAAITRGNVTAYKTLPSVQEVLVIDSSAVRGGLHQRDQQGALLEYSETLLPRKHGASAVPCAQRADTPVPWVERVAGALGRRKGMMRPGRAALAFGAWLALASPAVAATPSDHELQVAYCLGLHVTFWTDVVERDMKEDCAPDAPSVLKAYCETDKRTMADGPQIVNRLRDYLATKQLSLADSSITLAAKRGAADYWQTIGADHACLRGPEAACRPAADNALTRVNRCSAIINALPF